MKKILLAVVASFLLVAFAFAHTANPYERKAKAAKVHGKIKIVSSGADYDVKIVNSQADMDVKVCTTFARNPGEWIIVNSGEDFRIRIVRSCEDFSIRFVSVFPRVN